PAAHTIARTSARLRHLPPRDDVVAVGGVLCKPCGVGCALACWVTGVAMPWACCCRLSVRCLVSVWQSRCVSDRVLDGQMGGGVIACGIIGEQLASCGLPG